MVSNRVNNRSVALWIILLLGLFAVGAIIFGVAAHAGSSESSYGYGGMMGGGGEWGWMWGLGVLLMVSPFVLVIAILAVLAPGRPEVLAPQVIGGAHPNADPKLREA